VTKLRDAAEGSEPFVGAFEDYSNDYVDKATAQALLVSFIDIDRRIFCARQYEASIYQGLDKKGALQKRMYSLNMVFMRYWMHAHSLINDIAYATMKENHPEIYEMCKLTDTRTICPATLRQAVMDYNDGLDLPLDSTEIDYINFVQWALNNTKGSSGKAVSIVMKHVGAMNYEGCFIQNRKGPVHQSVSLDHDGRAKYRF
jgi:hypothetical protein